MAQEEEQSADSAQQAAAGATDAAANTDVEGQAGGAEPAEQLDPKERRRRARSAHPGEAGAQLSVEERVQRREEARRRKAAERRRYRKGRGAARHQPGTGTSPAERQPGTQKVRQGMVVSSKADKTITVRVESARRHPSYEKIIRRTKTLHAHDERNEAGEGDVVRLVETRPMSKTKRWRLAEVLERAK